MRQRWAWACSFAIVTALARPAAADEPRVGSVVVPGTSGRLLTTVMAVLNRPPPRPAPRMADLPKPTAELPRMTIATLFTIRF